MACVLSQLEYTDRVAKRAQYEAFEFAVEDGSVRVRNCSYEDPAKHEYSVTVTDGRPTECTCPADEHYETACKHRIAVAIREPVLDAATETDDHAAVREAGRAAIRKDADQLGVDRPRATDPDFSLQSGECESDSVDRQRTVGRSTRRFL